MRLHPIYKISVLLGMDRAVFNTVIKLINLHKAQYGFQHMRLVISNVAIHCQAAGLFAAAAGHHTGIITNGSALISSGSASQAVNPVTGAEFFVVAVEVADNDNGIVGHFSGVFFIVVISASGMACSLLCSILFREVAAYRAASKKMSTKQARVGAGFD